MIEEALALLRHLCPDFTADGETCFHDVILLYSLSWSSPLKIFHPEPKLEEDKDEKLVTQSHCSRWQQLAAGTRCRWQAMPLRGELISMVCWFVHPLIEVKPYGARASLTLLLSVISTYPHNQRHCLPLGTALWHSLRLTPTRGRNS